MTPIERNPSILVVEADQSLRELYADWCRPVGSVSTAASGLDALNKLRSERDTEIVLTERRLPDATGRELLTGLRDGTDRYVAFVTSSEPSFELVDLPVDSYLQKPVRAETMRKTLRRFVAQSSYGPPIRQYFALRSKISAIRGAWLPSACRANDSFTRVVARTESLWRRHREELVALDAGHEAWAARNPRTKESAPET